MSVKQILLTILIPIFLQGCTVAIKSSFQGTNKPLTAEDNVAILDIHHKVPEDAVKVGEMRFGDSGFSIDCNFNSNLIKAKKMAKENGANIVKIIEKRPPDLWSTCYRLKIVFYYYSGKVDDLPQLQIQ